MEGPTPDSGRRLHTWPGQLPRMYLTPAQKASKHLLHLLRHLTRAPGVRATWLTALVRQPEQISSSVIGQCMMGPWELALQVQRLSQEQVDEPTLQPSLFSSASPGFPGSTGDIWIIHSQVTTPPASQLQQSMKFSPHSMPGTARFPTSFPQQSI